MPPDVPPPLPPISVPPPVPPAKPEMVLTVLDKVNQRTGMFSKQAWRMIATDRRLIFAIHNKNNVDYMRQSPELTLAENPANFSIPLEMVNKIATYHGDFDSNEPDSMEIITPNGVMQYTISNYYKVQKQLKDALGSRVT